MTVDYNTYDGFKSADAVVSSGRMSAAANMAGYNANKIVIPTGMVSTNLKFYTSVDDVTYYPLMHRNRQYALTIPKGIGGIYSLNGEALAGCLMIKIETSDPESLPLTLTLLGQQGGTAALGGEPILEEG